MGTHPPLRHPIRESPARQRAERREESVIGGRESGVAPLCACPGSGCHWARTVPGDIAIARGVQRPASGTIDAAAEIFSLIGADYPSTVVLAVIGVGLLILLGGATWRCSLVLRRSVLSDRF